VQLKPNGICHLLWACTKLDHHAPDVLLAEVAADATARGWLASLQPMQLANFLHSYATLASRTPAQPEQHVQLVNAVASALSDQAYLDSCQPADISKIIWSLAKMKTSVQQLLLSSLADAALTQAEFFDAQSMANTVWGLEKLRFYSPALLDVFVDLAPRHMQRFKVSCLVNPSAMGG
jgi:hypothetical protein